MRQHLKEETLVQESRELNRRTPPGQARRHLPLAFIMILGLINLTAWNGNKTKSKKAG